MALPVGSFLEELPVITSGVDISSNGNSLRALIQKADRIHHCVK